MSALGGKRTLGELPSGGNVLMKKSTAVALGVAAAAALLIIPLVGPFTFYGVLVPILGPILPRPAGVPNHASASYHWKGPGMLWKWRRPLPHGCVEWGASKSYAVVDLVRGEGCASGGRRLRHMSFKEEIVFDPSRAKWWGGKPCPYSVPAPEIVAFAQLATEATSAAETEAEKAVLLAIQERLSKANGSELTTDHSGGCNDLKVADYAPLTGPPPPRHIDVWEQALASAP